VPVVRGFYPSYNNLHPPADRSALGECRVRVRLTSPPFRGMMYVHNPAELLAVRPNLTHGARRRTVCPRIGNMSRSSTPPRKRAPRPAHTITASGGPGVQQRYRQPRLQVKRRANVLMRLAGPVKACAPPSTTCMICCTAALTIVPPTERKRARSQLR
jgi:hypothetical protein